MAIASVAVPAPLRAQSGEGDEYTSRIAPIFERRCVACHSCYNAPCQFNVQSYAGAARGAAKTNVYDATRLKSVAPTRLGIDAASTANWRAKGFFDVLQAGQADQSLLIRLARLRQQNPHVQPEKQVAQSQVCPVNASDPRLADPKALAAIGMPYGLPPLTPEDADALQGWIARGAAGPRPENIPSRATLTKAVGEQVRRWEAFLNAPDPRRQLVSRYIYEHLFLAHLHVSEEAQGAARPPERPRFFRLVRSRRTCDSGIDEIATRRPTDRPDAAAMFYCLKPVEGAIVEKTHIPYALSAAKLARVEALFFGEPWTLGDAGGKRPDDEQSPFERFADIPVKARYQFLLDDAHYHIATFIKGPVCNGSEAVNSIQEQFFVFFLKPSADSMVMLPAFARTADTMLRLPGDYGSDIGVLEDLDLLPRIVDYRERYRRLRADSVRQLRPNGYALDDIWDGDGDNRNAILTVFRHFDNAAVVKGAVGDLSKTVFVLDYSLFERLVYNLVVDFDVFGNVGHQVLTRIYMDLIRMEAEELFLSFLPPADRQKLRNAWYVGGLLTDIKMKIVFPITNAGQPTAIRFKTGNTKQEFVERALFERLAPGVRGAADPINWRRIQEPGGGPRRSAIEDALRVMAAIPAADATPFSRYFSEFSILLVTRQDGKPEVYSIVHNRELENVSWIIGEDQRLAPQEDTLTIARGVLGAYPDMLFVVDEGDIAAFSAMAAAVTDERGYADLVDRFGVRRTAPRFWETFDAINRIARGADPIHRGLLDLTRYALEPGAP
jgi:hypothetical protein